MNTYLIQAILGEQFEDLYIEATSAEEARRDANEFSELYRSANRGQRRFVRFVVA